MRNRKYLVVLIALISVLALGIVFAATAGLLTFNGTAVINPNAKVVFDSVQFEDGSPEDDYNISPDGQTLDFTVHLEGRDDIVIINYAISNIGNVPVNMSPIQVMSAGSPGVDFIIPYNDPFEMGSGTGQSGQIHVILTDETLPEGSYTFSATLNYEQAA